ncbi:hypothetical protein ABZY00_21330 [Streptomyces griseoflavus]|uniref:hypothetical protein n=1 Tax=Streptomyces griseoflavus TaxID=35619 RepID=UPI00167D8F9F|nr:hypothetical protein [Streptomyces griseoflavus]GGV51544.1 hypothetical protein GCM10010293_63460 [Streptomyces griseoflavus]
MPALRRDDRAPLTEPRAVAGLSGTAVKRRLERLRATGTLYPAGNTTPGRPGRASGRCSG